MQLRQQTSLLRAGCLPYLGWQWSESATATVVCTVDAAKRPDVLSAIRASPFEQNATVGTACIGRSQAPPDFFIEVAIHHFDDRVYFRVMLNAGRDRELLEAIANSDCFAFQFIRSGAAENFEVLVIKDLLTVTAQQLLGSLDSGGYA